LIDGVANILERVENPKGSRWISSDLVRALPIVQIHKLLENDQSGGPLEVQPISRQWSQRADQTGYSSCIFNIPCVGCGLLQKFLSIFFRL
jgi:hypothetical protein